MNLFTIYAISNIHDVTWGSRPTEEKQQDAFKAVERKKGIEYRDYRSRFLVFWCICNLVVGYYLVYLYTNGNQSIIFNIGAFLTSVILFRIFFSTVHYIKAKWDKFNVKQYTNSRVSTVFNNLDKYQVEEKEEIFAVYFDYAGNSALVKKDDPRYKQSVVQSSVRAQDVYRGFSVSMINRKHQISQSGLIDHRASAKGLPVYTKDMDNFFGEEDSDAGDEEDHESDSSVSEINANAENRSNNKKSNIRDSEPKRLEIMSPSIVNPFQNNSSA